MCEITRFARHQTTCNRTIFSYSVWLSHSDPQRLNPTPQGSSDPFIQKCSSPLERRSQDLRSLKIPGTQHFHRGLVDQRSGTAGTILRRDDHPGFCFAATRSDRPAIDQETAHSSPPASARSRAARRSMLPEVPQTRRRPAVRKEPSLKSDTQHTGVLHSCLVASRV